MDLRLRLQAKPLCLCFVSAATNYHQLSDLSQHSLLAALEVRGPERESGAGGRPGCWPSRLLLAAPGDSVPKAPALWLVATPCRPLFPLSRLLLTLTSSRPLRGPLWLRWGRHDQVFYAERYRYFTRARSCCRDGTRGRRAEGQSSAPGEEGLAGAPGLPPRAAGPAHSLGPGPVVKTNPVPRPLQPTRGRGTDTEHFTSTSGTVQARARPDSPRGCTLSHPSPRCPARGLAHSPLPGRAIPSPPFPSTNSCSCFKT